MCVGCPCLLNSELLCACSSAWEYGIPWHCYCSRRFYTLVLVPRTSLHTRGGSSPFQNPIVAVTVCSLLDLGHLTGASGPPCSSELLVSESPCFTRFWCFILFSVLWVALPCWNCLLDSVCSVQLFSPNLLLDILEGSYRRVAPVRLIYSVPPGKSLRWLLWEVATRGQHFFIPSCGSLKKDGAVEQVLLRGFRSQCSAPEAAPSNLLGCVKFIFFGVRLKYMCMCRCIEFFMLIDIHISACV